MTQVAMAFGQPFMRVWRAPFHETLLAYCGVAERRRIEGLETHAREVRAAFRVNAAFAAPKQLEQERAAMLAALRRVPGVERRTESAADLIAKYAHLQPAPDGD